MKWPLWSLLGIVLSAPVWAEDFPTPVNSEKDLTLTPQSPAAAAAGFRVPDGFQVKVFAAEPDVQNPIDYAWDTRGRLWIAESYTYEGRPDRFNLSLRDRILIFEDTNGDGQFDQRTVFLDTLQQLTSIEVGLGGVWALCPPQLLFIPDQARDDTPDGPAVVVLEGFDVPPENHHNLANGLRWGLDGWLYGRCGASSPGRVGLPGTPKELRTPLVGGIWRYHPGRKHFETLCHGTTNPWGHDWNQRGEGFFVNTVNGHLWHLIPGAHYRRPHTIDPNPRAYAPMEMHADHWHWDTNKDWTDSRSASGEHDQKGGGHAHTGCTIYQGTNWPENYRDRLMTLNMHGRRTNVEKLERHGSGYVGRHDPDILFASDPFYRAVELTYGPDGGVYLLDWSDTGECHEHTGVHRTSGRIYKVTYGQPTQPPTHDLRGRTAVELLDFHEQPNEWLVRFARRELADRKAMGQSTAEVTVRLKERLSTAQDPVHRLRYVWTLATLGSFDELIGLKLLQDPDEAVRTWGIRLLTDAWPLDSVMGPTEATLKEAPANITSALSSLASTDPSGLVRLAVASTLQRLPVQDRLILAQQLWRRAEDANDQNLPLLSWYGIIPVAEQEPVRLANAAGGCRWPLVRQFIARRLAEDLEKRPEGVERLIALLPTEQDPAVVRDILSGLLAGLKGWRKAPEPKTWAAAQIAIKTPDEATQLALRELRILFGDGRALADVKKLALDPKADLNDRKAALTTLIEQRPDDLQQICEKLLETRFLNTLAVKGLAASNDPAVGARLAKNYRKFHHSERAAVMETLTARPVFAQALLQAMAAGQIPREDLSAFQARQIRSFGDESLTKRLTEVWGELRDSPVERRQLIEKLRTELTEDVLTKADLSQGRVVFQKICANCHRLYGQGGGIGPDLTGAGRHNLDYLLENLVDPSAVVSKDYRLSIVVTRNGQTLNGIIVEQTERTVTLQTAKERVTIDRREIEEIVSSPLSLMPDGVIPTLTPEQIRNLFAYLRHPTQVAWPKGFDPANPAQPVAAE